MSYKPARRDTSEEVVAGRPGEQVGLLEGDLLAAALLPLAAQPHERRPACTIAGGRSFERHDLDRLDRKRPLCASVDGR